MDQIDQVRQKTDIVELISSYIPLKKAGRNFKALCPFHSEKTPSFVVSPERQIFKCFGCGVGGDVFKFLIEYENMEFAEALRFLAEKAGIKLKSYKPSKKYQQKKKIYSINHLASEYYHYLLTKHQLGKKALNYLKKRGISKKSIDQFKLGYAPQGWRNLTQFLTQKKDYKKQEVESAGLILKSQSSRFKVSRKAGSRSAGQSSYYDRFRGRIIFPLFDHRSNIVGFSGRTMKKNLKGAKYINTPETITYHKSDLFYGLNWSKKEIKKKDRAIIVEGEFDFISSYQVGVRNVIAIKGTALTPNQVELIKHYTDNIALALDEDTAGDSAARRGIKTADNKGLNIRIIQVKYGKDPDECAQHSAKLWRQSCKRAIPVYDFYLKSAVSRYGKKGPEAKKKITEELVPIISQISNQVVKAHYLAELAEVLGVSQEAVAKEINRYNRQKKVDYKREKPKKQKPQKTRQEKLEELLLAFILQGETEKLLKQIDLKIIQTNAVKKIIKALKKYLKDIKKFKINLFAKKLPQELIETLDNAYLLDIKEILKDEEVLKNQFEKTKKELQKISCRGQICQLVEKIREQEKNGGSKKMQELTKKFSKISQKLKDLT